MAKFGARRWRATVQQHDGTVDDHGQPTYSVDSDWDSVLTGLPVELLSTTGGETIRGRQTTAESSHIGYCDYHAGSSVTAGMRLVIDSHRYNVVAVLDELGKRRELRLELRREIG
jgi:head-tail adaptor